ncbi:hypothetical protein ANOM_009559 [Aspergillus nomiae NRRL 13137]|uniref:Chorismate-utilising enzyme C-terminal domain-containing protein n=1 Tax=Aspergillus nomiae NRRL (strain ATCC 15546 / NRRL 13137 / CBS 260.88 / M93) TaxID=1509407 RepID=A0A0L1IT79_ASPN3|nr:uncharacterized protein ANOM_009559 [Aspergillus nomiae NRRL 13137]KNG82702.1 hypothetical protein ANOM_009559 [Aspergillus nomiae NRRL 13137]
MTSSAIFHLPGQPDALETAVKLLQLHQNDHHYAYERDDQCHSTWPVEKSLLDIARDFVSEYTDPCDGRIFGYAGYNFGPHMRGEAYLPGQWPILSLMAPVLQVVVHKSHIARLLFIDLDHNKDVWTSQVRKALVWLNKGDYGKITPSRSVPLNRRVDLVSTLFHGRRGNTPRRTFCFDYECRGSVGFSPELVVQVKNKKLVMDAVAGTRSSQGTPEKTARLRQELLDNPKEVFEHILTTKAAMKTLRPLCQPGSVRVEELVSVVSRGPVQHLYSSVVGDLPSNKDAWDALALASPGFSHSKSSRKMTKEELKALEIYPRELYMGSVLFIEGNDSMEAANALRSVFQDENRQWLQAGAGIIAHSTPERELIETREKLASVQPYVMAKAE